MIDPRKDDRKFDPDLELDFLDLEPAVAMQSSLFGYYSDAAVDARKERDEKANELDTMRATVELEVRERAAKNGEKLTEGKVSALVDTDKRITDLMQEVVDKNYAMQKLESKARSLDKKNSMIECAVRMVLSRSNGTSLHGVSDEFAGDSSQNSIRRRLNGRD